MLRGQGHTLRQMQSDKNMFYKKNVIWLVSSGCTCAMVGFRWFQLISGGFRSFLVLLITIIAAIHSLGFQEGGQ